MSPTNERLGFPPAARLLLVNADDCGMYDAINQAVVRAIQSGMVRSTSVMMPCPAAVSAIAQIRDLPGLSVGVHLSLVRDIPDYRWGPMAPRDRVPSLLAVDGELYHTAHLDELLRRAELAEVELEFRAQIDAALATQLRPTHLDWHCLIDGGRQDIFDLTMALAREYGVAVRVSAPSHIADAQAQGLATLDFPLLDSFALPLTGKAERYVALLRALPAGLTEWAVHPGLDTPAARARDPEGWAVRCSDYEFLTLTRAQEIIAAEGIVLVNYAPLQQAWRAHGA